MKSPKFTEETRAIIIEALKVNPSIYSAAAAADINYQTLMRWIQKGEEGVEGFVEFSQECAAARGQMKDEIVKSLFEIATDTMHPQAVRAARELLTALYPREFSAVRHIVQHKAEQGVDQLEVKHMATGELRQLQALLKKAQDGPINPERQQPVKMLVDVIEADAEKRRERNPN